MTIPSADITGLLLAGGQGARMGGADKGLLVLDGVTLAERVLQRLRPQVGTLLINANRHAEQWAGFDHPVIGDQLSGYPGPLAGMHAGLSACRTTWLATVPCDSPFLPADLVARLAAGLTQQEGAELAVARTADGLQPVFALLSCSLDAPLADYLAGGGRKLDRWMLSRRLAVVDFADAGAFANINTPEELAAAAR